MSAPEIVHQIFLSYAREDLQNVQEIYRLLTQNGFSVWMDEQDLLPGQSWKLAIEKAIGESNIFIACLSSKSVSKTGYVQKELRLAYEVLDTMPEEKVYIVPIRLDNCAIPSKLSGIQWLNFFEPGSKEKLIQTISAHLGISTTLEDIQPDQLSSNQFFDAPLPVLKKTFTQVEKDHFLRESFDYIKEYFRTALQKLQRDQLRIKTDFDDMSSINKFESKIYIRGKLARQCLVSLAGGGYSPTNSIAYSENTHLMDLKSYRTQLIAREKEEKLGLQIWTVGMHEVDEPVHTKEKAAEFLWKRLTWRLM